MSFSHLSEMEQIARQVGLHNPTFRRNVAEDGNFKVRALLTVLDLESGVYHRPYLVTDKATGASRIGKLDFQKPVKRGRGRPRKV